MLRMDNVPEFISLALAEWAEKHAVKIECIQPGKPTQNAFIERFNRTYRTEILDSESHLPLSGYVGIHHVILVALLLSAEHLTCPITLSFPERGVFVRTSLQSEVSCLYNSATLKLLLMLANQHSEPLSRTFCGMRKKKMTAASTANRMNIQNPIQLLT